MAGWRRGAAGVRGFTGPGPSGNLCGPQQTGPPLELALRAQTIAAESSRCAGPSPRPLPTTQAVPEAPHTPAAPLRCGPECRGGMRTAEAILDAHSGGYENAVVERKVNRRLAPEGGEASASNDMSDRTTTAYWITSLHSPIRPPLPRIAVSFPFTTTRTRRSNRSLGKGDSYSR